MAYPDPHYHGETGEISGRFRPANEGHPLMMGSDTAVHYLATGASTNEQSGLYRWEAMPLPMELPAFVVFIAGPIELLGGVLVMIGLFAGWAAFLCSGLMAFAYWMVHGTQALLPIQNMGELAALYCFVFLYISSQGSGIWSVDAARKVV